MITRHSVTVTEVEYDRLVKLGCLIGIPEESPLTTEIKQILVDCSLKYGGSVHRQTELGDSEVEIVLLGIPRARRPKSLIEE